MKIYHKNKKLPTVIYFYYYYGKYLELLFRIAAQYSHTKNEQTLS